MKYSKVILAFFGLFFLLTGNSLAYDINITATSDGSTAQTDFACGETIVLSIDLNNTTTEDKVAGVAFTIVYPDAVVDPPAIGTDGLPTTSTEIMSAFPFMTGTTKTYRAGDSVVGELALSGAEVDPATGGATNHAENAQLFTVSFTVKSGATLGNYQFGIQTTTLNNSAAGWNGESSPVMVGAVPSSDTTNFNDLSGGAFPTLLSSVSKTSAFSVTSCDDTVSLDADGNGNSDALSDGVLIIRHLFNFTGDSLTSGAVATDCTRCTATDISTYLTAAGLSLMDADGNGVADALSDGVLIIRYLFNFTGTSLTDGAVSSDCTRCDAASIEAFLDSVK